jgi:hypothetical protein
MSVITYCNNDRGPNNMHQRTSPVEELQAGPASGQDIHHNSSSWLLAGCSGAVRLVPDQRLLRQSCIVGGGPASLQCDMDHGTSAARCGKARLGRIQVGALVAAGEGGFVGGGQ